MLQLEQTLNFTAASTMLSLMAVALTSLILPVTLYTVLQRSAADTKDAILGLSRVAIILLILFRIYLYFQQKLPANFFDVEQYEEEDVPESSEEQTFKKELMVFGAVLALLLIIFVMMVCADNLVSSIGSVIERTPITKGFIRFVVLPTIGNIARPATAVFAAYKNKLGLAIDIVIGSIMQLTLFVMPFVVLLGWAIDQPMQLEFGFLETLCFLLCVFVVNLLIQDRKINYLGGAICVTM
jgi:Ca2+:H+ antiporter